MYIPEDRMEIAILDFLGVKRGQKAFANILREEYFTILHLKLPLVEFTSDETDLLFWIMW